MMQPIVPMPMPPPPGPGVPDMKAEHAEILKDLKEMRDRVSRMEGELSAARNVKGTAPTLRSGIGITATRRDGTLDEYDYKDACDETELAESDQRVSGGDENNKSEWIAFNVAEKGEEPRTK